MEHATPLDTAPPSQGGYITFLIQPKAATPMPSKRAPSPRIIMRKPTPAEQKEAESWGTWEKEPSNFDWNYDEQETCLILEGTASVVSKDKKQSVSFGPNDWVIFPVGLQCTWTIKQKIRKKYKFG